MIIGLTGGIGSGKSTALNALKEKGYSVISCDEITKELYKKRKILKVLRKEFPTAIKGKIFYTQFQFSTAKMKHLLSMKKSSSMSLNSSKNSAVMFGMKETRKTYCQKAIRTNTLQMASSPKKKTSWMSGSIVVPLGMAF